MTVQRYRYFLYKQIILQIFSAFICYIFVIN
nr:MAG TPA: hypothetical protein [Caudoviricetes sp.]